MEDPVLIYFLQENILSKVLEIDFTGPGRPLWKGIASISLTSMTKLTILIISLAH